MIYYVFWKRKYNVGIYDVCTLALTVAKTSFIYIYKYIYIYVLFTPLDAGNVKHMIYQNHLWVNNTADLYRVC